MAAKKMEFNPSHKNESTDKHSKGSKVIELTQKEVADNLKAQEKALEKEKARIINIENTAAAVEEDIDEQIAEKKAQLMELPVAEKKVVAEVKEEKKPAKKERKWDINPLNWARHIGTRALSGVLGFPSRVAAKVKHIVARPQQLWSKQLYKDIGKNILKTPKAILTTITGAFYKPHRDSVKFEDSFKDYGPEFANPTDKSKLMRVGKKALWGAGKVAVPVTGGLSLLPKFFANVGRGMNHAIHETFEGIRDSKFHFNPMKWNLKSWKFSKTKEAFRKAFGWNVKGTPAGKSVDVKHLAEKEHKKAA